MFVLSLDRNTFFVIFLSVVCIEHVNHVTLAASPSSSSGGVALELRYRFEEEQPAGTTVGHVARDANLARLYNPEVLRQLSFRFLKQQQSAEFTIDSSTGVIKSAGRIDRETLCPSASVSGPGLPSSESQATAVNSGCDIRLDVAVQPLPYFRIIRVSVSVVDINDNVPRFATDKLSIEVPESTQVGATILTPEATDSDGPEFGVKSYRLATESDRFVLTSGSSSSGGSGPEVRLVLTKPLDREQVDQYNLKILAFDGGFPPNSGFVDVSISVTDVNDNSPVFDQDSYEASIPENVAIGTTFLRVAAVDYDLGLNGEVTYSLSSHSAAAHGHLFSVESSTGDVSVRGPIDYEEGAVHRLTVIARDRGGTVGGESSGSASVPVVVHVIDLNDNAPTVSVDTLSSTPGAAEIAENSQIGSFVAHLSVADRDAGNNGRFACSPENPGGGHEDGSSFFRLTPMFGSSEEFQIVTAAIFDREQRDRYEVIVTCRDFGAEPMTSSVRVVVLVTDQNDNDPVFDKTTYVGDLIENNYVGATLLQVNATDADLGDNADVRYSIAAGDPASAWFDIDTMTGVLTAGVSFDRETTDVVRFRVVARDRGTPTRSSTAHVTIAILDVNDERPTFSHPGYSFAVSENRPTGTQIGQVVARDRDGSVYGEISYYMVAPTTSTAQSSASSHRGIESLPFEINPRTGTLSTTRELDREQPGGGESVFHFTVGASDRGVPPLSGTVNVTIYVTDENDNRPSFIFPIPSNRTVQVSARAPVNHVITRLLTHDPDVGRNSRISYSIDTSSSGKTTGNTGSTDSPNEEDRNLFFDVDAERGVVIVNRPLMEVDGRIFELNVVASDHGVPALSAQETLVIVVNRSLAYFAPENEPMNNEHHLGSYSAFQMMIGSRNFIIVVVLAAISFAIALALIIAIIVIRRQDRRDVIVRGDEKTISGGGTGGVGATNKYNCRTETIKMLRAHQKSSSSIDERQPLSQGQTGSTSNVGATLKTAMATSVILDEGTLLMRRAVIGSGPHSPICDTETAGTGLLSMERSGHTWPSAISNEYQNPQACSSMLTDPSAVNGNGVTSFQHYPVGMTTDLHDPRSQSFREAEVNRLLKVLQQSDAVVPAAAVIDTDSDGSNADSGRGTSELEIDSGTTGRTAATMAFNCGGYRDQMQPQYYDPRLRQQFPTSFRSNHLESPDSIIGNNHVTPDVSSVTSNHTYSPSGRNNAQNLSTFSVNNTTSGNGVSSRPSTPTTTLPPQPYPTSGRYFVNDLSAASLDRKQFANYNPAPTRYAVNACTDLPDDTLQSSTMVGYRSGRIGYHPGPSSPGSNRRYPVAVRTPQLGGSGCQGNMGCYANGIADESMYAATDLTPMTNETGQYSFADISGASEDRTNPIDRSGLSNDTTSSSVNPEELCNEIDNLFFKA